MKTNRTAWTWIALAAIAAFAAGAASAADEKKDAPAEGSGGKLYTRCNIWYEKDEISSINYKKGAIMPAGTEVTNIQMLQEGRVRKVKYIQFTVVKDGSTFKLECEPKYNPGMDMEAVKDRFFSNKNFDELTKGFSKMEIDCIKAGVLKPGMSKDAVIVAYGYPPKHETPSLESNVWTYWRARMVEKKIYFDDKGKTSSGQQAEEGTL